MRTKPATGFALVVALVVSTAAATAQDRPGRTEQIANGGILHLLPADAVTEHSIDTGHGRLTYTATAGTLPFFDQSGQQSASVFYTAYVAKDAGANRPLTFVFNGGPGAASAFLHLGLAGPRLLDLGPGGRNAAHADLIDNPDSWLRFTDLVFIDPIGTGWSRAAKSSDTKHFWGVNSDAEAMAKAIALYVDHNNRGASRKYLFGESYGGFRAVKVARALQHDQGLPIDGIVMLSPLLKGWLTFGDDDDALRAALQLPSLAAAELERKKAFSPGALAAAEKFAIGDYLTTLVGPPPKGEAAKAFYSRVADVSGMPLEQVTRLGGFISDTFVKSLRAGDDKIVSAYDATFAVDDPFPELRSSHGSDPILGGITRAYGGGMADYARNELGFKTEMTYTLLAAGASREWDWPGSKTQADCEADLRVLLSYGPSFRVLIAHGLSDMVTPYSMTRYVLDHMPQIGGPNRIALKLYRGGHMLYLDPQSRHALSDDVAAFFKAGEAATR
jgi:carboxypeptidase C (cathepsin A)